MRRFLHALALFEILAICVVLLGAFWVQFGNDEYPCPLCIIQRMAMMLCALGPASIVMEGLRSRIVSTSTVMAGYGMSILGACVGLAASSRQLLMHIMPEGQDYGSEVMGLHLYTWALIVFLTVMAFSGARLFLTPSLTADAGPNRLWSPIVLSIFGLIIAANIVSVFFEAGFHLFLPDDPTSYRLLSGD